MSSRKLRTPIVRKRERSRCETNCASCCLKVVGSHEFEVVSGDELSDDRCSVRIVATAADCFVAIKLDVAGASYRRTPDGDGPMCDFAVVARIGSCYHVLVVELKTGSAPTHALKQLEGGLSVLSSVLPPLARHEFRSVIASRGQDDKLRRILSGGKRLRFRGTASLPQVVRCGAEIKVCAA